MKSSREQLLETSRQLGMAEVAVNVLHNVGNVLTSMNVSATQLVKFLHESHTNDIGKIAKTVQAHHDDLAEFLTQDSQGKHIFPYLAKFDEHLAAQHQAMFEEIQALTKNLDHVKHIIRAQQANTTSTNHSEPVVVSELMEQALSINLSPLSQHHVKIVRNYADTPLIISDKHQILQILVNLIRNATHAMIENPGDSHCLSLTIDQSPEDHRIQLSVHDTGVGTNPEHLTQIFLKALPRNRKAMDGDCTAVPWLQSPYRGHFTRSVMAKGKGLGLPWIFPSYLWRFMPHDNSRGKSKGVSDR